MTKTQAVAQMTMARERVAVLEAEVEQLIQHHADYHAYCSARQTVCPHEAEVARLRGEVIAMYERIIPEQIAEGCSRAQAEVERLRAFEAEALEVRREFGWKRDGRGLVECIRAALRGGGK